MGIAELIMLAVGLSMDAFAVAICAGLSMTKTSMKKALIVGLYFGIFQAGMPLIGYFPEFDTCPPRKGVKWGKLHAKIRKLSLGVFTLY